jgi:hypothetical protein
MCHGVLLNGQLQSQLAPTPRELEVRNVTLRKLLSHQMLTKIPHDAFRALPEALDSLREMTPFGLEISGVFRHSLYRKSYRDLP